MSWIRGLGRSVWVAIGIFFVVMAAAAASRNKATADRWRDKAVDIEAGNLIKGVDTAKAALSQAKKFDARADELQAKAVKAMDNAGRKDESTSLLIDRWRRT